MKSSTERNYFFTFLSLLILGTSSFIVLTMPTHIDNIVIYENDTDTSQKTIFTKLDIFDAVEGEKINFSWSYKLFQESDNYNKIYTQTILLDEYAEKDKVNIDSKLNIESQLEKGFYKVEATLSNTGKSVSTVFEVK